MNEFKVGDVVRIESAEHIAKTYDSMMVSAMDKTCGKVGVVIDADSYHDRVRVRVGDEEWYYLNVWVKRSFKNMREKRELGLA
jgi:hypothetical protein